MLSGVNCVHCACGDPLEGTQWPRCQVQHRPAPGFMWLVRHLSLAGAAPLLVVAISDTDITHQGFCARYIYIHGHLQLIFRVRLKY